VEFIDFKPYGAQQGYSTYCEKWTTKIMATKSILLIDDEETVRELVSVCLSDLAGWDIITVASAQEGLNQLAIQCPDAILLDILMPGMDTITFLERLHENPVTQSIPVILLTVRARWFTPQKLQHLGVIQAIAKPFNPVNLPYTIAQALQWELQTDFDLGSNSNL
jgi:CheY-like chemotaxis protein